MHCCCRGPNHQETRPLTENQMTKELDLQDVICVMAANSRIRYKAEGEYRGYEYAENGPTEYACNLVSASVTSRDDMDLLYGRISGENQLKQLILRCKVSGDYSGPEYHHIGVFLDEKAPGPDGTPRPVYVIAGGEESAKYAKATPNTLCRLLRSHRTKLNQQLRHPFNIDEPEDKIFLT